MARLDIPPGIEVARLKELRRKFENSRSESRVSVLFAAIRFCFSQEILVPEWAVQAFFDATNAWYSLRARSLDEAFGTSSETSKHLEQRKRRRLLFFQVWNHVRARKVRLESVDWKRLAEELGSSKTVLQDLYYKKRSLYMPESSPAFDKLIKPYKVEEALSRKIKRKKGKV